MTRPMTRAELQPESQPESRPESQPESQPESPLYSLRSSKPHQLAIATQNEAGPVNLGRACRAESSAVEKLWVPKAHAQPSFCFPFG